MFLNDSFDCIFGENGSEFHRDAPQNETRFKQVNARCRDIYFDLISRGDIWE